MKSLSSSELILNPGGSIYHIHLRPEQISDTIITVGDPARVSQIIRYFDTTEFDQQYREFRTATGIYKNKRLTVLSTGIGTDNIDIVFNELDALVNIDFNTRTIKEEHTSLDFIRIGTSGAIQKQIPIDSYIASSYAIGFDNLLHFYKSKTIRELSLEKSIEKYLPQVKIKPYCVAANHDLLQQLDTTFFEIGITATNSGFYGPQGRRLRANPSISSFINELSNWQSTDYKDLKLTNLEMETSGIYGMAKLLGHRAISLNAILANRIKGTFSSNPEAAIDKLIKHTLAWIINTKD